MFVSRTINLLLPGWVFLIQQKCFCIRQHVLFNYSIFFQYVFFKSQRKTVIKEKGYVLDALETLTSLLSVFTSRRKLSDLFKRKNLETEMVENSKLLRATVSEKTFEILQWHFQLKAKCTSLFLHTCRNGNSPGYKGAYTITA